MSRSALPLTLVTCAIVGCAGDKPPARWAEGGAPLHLVAAQWQFKGDPVDVRSRGDYAEILIDGDVEWVVDRVGRLYDKNQRPVAVLDADGRLVMAKDQLMGVVGSQYATKPGRGSAWLSLTPEGDVVKYGLDGRQELAGRWVGCNVSVYARQACLLASYVILYDDEGDDTSSGPPMMAPGAPGLMPGGLIVPR
jgi:hypothetical protein